VSAAMIDTDVARQWQYEDVGERVNRFKVATAA
jgi:hypothetical protein